MDRENEDDVGVLESDNESNLISVERFRLLTICMTHQTSYDRGPSTANKINQQRHLRRKADRQTR